MPIQTLIYAHTDILLHIIRILISFWFGCWFRWALSFIKIKSLISYFQFLWCEVGRTTPLYTLRITSYYKQFPISSIFLSDWFWSILIRKFLEIDSTTCSEISNVHIGTFQSVGVPTSPFQKCKQSLSKTGQNRNN